MNSERRRRALNDLLDAHGERLYATLFRLTLRRDVASELLQELFVRLGSSAGFDQADDGVAYAWRAAINRRWIAAPAADTGGGRRCHGDQVHRTVAPSAAGAGGAI